MATVTTTVTAAVVVAHAVAHHAAAGLDTEFLFHLVAEGHAFGAELGAEFRHLIGDKMEKELGIQPCRGMMGNGMGYHNGGRHGGGHGGHGGHGGGYGSNCNY